MSKGLKIGIVVVLIIIAIAAVWYLVKGGSSANDWKKAAIKKLTDANIAYGAFTGVTDWNQYAAWIKVNICGMGGGDADTPCYNSAQPKVTQFFSELNVQPTNTIMDKLKVDIVAYVNSN